MERVTYVDSPCKSAINPVVGMPFKWSVNPYRGCRHRCVYCYARQYQAWHELDAGLDFENKVFVKTNLAQVLRAELRKPGWKREVVVVGTATDCYQPAEGHYRLTRGALEALRDQHNPTHLITKGTMVYRDIDVLAELSQRAECTVFVSVTSVDEDIWRRLEPGTPPPLKRLQIMRELVDSGINAGVLMAPTVPGITTAPGVIERLVEAAAKYRARFVGHGVLRLAPGTREWYLAFIEREYPQLHHAYLKLYARPHAPREYTAKVAARVAAAQASHRIGAGLPPLPKAHELQPALLADRSR